MKIITNKIKRSLWKKSFFILFRNLKSFCRYFKKKSFLNMTSSLRIKRQRNTPRPRSYIKIVKIFEKLGNISNRRIYQNFRVISRNKRMFVDSEIKPIKICFSSDILYWISLNQLFTNIVYFRNKYILYFFYKQILLAWTS